MKKGNLQKLFGKLVRCKLKQRSEICVGHPGALAMRLGPAGLPPALPPPSFLAWRRLSGGWRSHDQGVVPTKCTIPP
jgi:hypothetical protein